jgi:inner membrane protein YidH
VHPTTSVDSRALQANERTLLAWLRSGISLITFGFVIARLGVWLELTNAGGRRIPGAPWVGGLFVLLGTITDAVGIVRYMAFRRALLAGAPTPTRDASVVIIAVAVTVLGALLGALVVASVF